MTTSIKDNELLYHYTSMDAVCGGMLTKDGISFRLTHYAYLNDRSEFDLGRDLFRTRLKGSAREYVQYMGDEPRYILSLSRKKDFLPMWSMYGKNGNGLMLGLKAEKVYQQTGGVLFDCLYCDENFNLDKDEDEEYIKASLNVYYTIKEKIGCVEIATQHLHKKLNELVPLVKSNYFSYEEEVRLALSADNYSVSYRSIGNMLIPYISILLPKDFLRKIMIGPTLETQRAKESIRMYLDSMGYKHVKLEISKAPYRG